MKKESHQIKGDFHAAGMNFGAIAKAIIRDIAQTPKIAFKAFANGHVSPKRFAENLNESVMLSRELFKPSNWKKRISERNKLDKFVTGVRYATMGYFAYLIGAEALAADTNFTRIVALSAGLAAMPCLFSAQRIGGQKTKVGDREISGHVDHVNAQDTVNSGLQTVQLAALGLWPYAIMGAVFTSSAAFQAAMKNRPLFQKARLAVTNSTLAIGIPAVAATTLMQNDPQMQIIGGILIPTLAFGAWAGSQTVEKLHRTFLMHAGANGSVVTAATIAGLTQTADVFNIIVMYGAGTLNLARTLQDIAPKFDKDKNALSGIQQAVATVRLAVNPKLNDQYYFNDSPVITGTNEGIEDTLQKGADKSAVKPLPILKAS